MKFFAAMGLLLVSLGISFTLGGGPKLTVRHKSPTPAVEAENASTVHASGPARPTEASVAVE